MSSHLFTWEHVLRIWACSASSGLQVTWIIPRVTGQLLFIRYLDKVEANKALSPSNNYPAFPLKQGRPAFISIIHGQHVGLASWDVRRVVGKEGSLVQLAGPIHNVPVATLMAEYFIHLFQAADRKRPCHNKPAYRWEKQMKYTCNQFAINTSAGAPAGMLAPLCVKT